MTNDDKQKLINLLTVAQNTAQWHIGQHDYGPNLTAYENLVEVMRIIKAQSPQDDFNAGRDAAAKLVLARAIAIVGDGAAPATIPYSELDGLFVAIGSITAPAMVGDVSHG